jgi:hypothetical protein
VCSQARARGGAAFSPALSDDKRHLLSTGDSPGDLEGGVLRSAPPPPWVDLNQELVEEMERVNRKTEDLKKLHRQHLLPGFDEDDRHSGAILLPFSSYSSQILPPFAPICSHFARFLLTEEHQIDQLAREIAQSLQSCDLGVTSQAVCLLLVIHGSILRDCLCLQVKQIAAPGGARNLSPQEARFVMSRFFRVFFECAFVRFCSSSLAGFGRALRHRWRHDCTA